MRRALAVLVAALLTSGPAWAADYSVCSTGADYTTVAACVAAASSGAGDNCHLCNENFGAVAISSSKTYVNIRANTTGVDGGTGTNAVASDHSITGSHPIFDGGGSTGTALDTGTGWYIVGVEIRNYTDYGRKNNAAGASWNNFNGCYLHNIGSTTTEACVRNTDDQNKASDWLYYNSVLQDCAGYGIDHSSGGSWPIAVRRVSVINPGNAGIYISNSAANDVFNVLVTSHDAAAAWGVYSTNGTCRHATVIAGASAFGIHCNAVEYSITDGGAIGVCYGSRSQNVVANATSPWKDGGSGCVTDGSADAGSTTTAPTYVDTTDYVPCTGSSADGLSGSSTMTADLWNVSRVHPEDAGSAEAQSCGPPPGTLGLRVDGGVLDNRVTGGTPGNRVD